MKIAVGADHAGFALKEDIRKFLASKGAELKDVGVSSPDSVDYPDYAEKVALLVSDGTCERGILVCGSGIGMAMTANKIPDVRAATCNDAYSAKVAREHNDANVLALGARIIDFDHAKDIINVWLNTEFLGGRHARRVDKVKDIEEKYLKKTENRRQKTKKTENKGNKQVSDF